MAITITITGTPISFPSSAESPNWAPGIIEFAQAVESALNSVLGAYDVAPQIQVIDAQNPGTDVDVANLAFPVSSVTGAFIRYSLIRTTSTDTAYEAGNLIVTYNPAGGVGQKWEISRDYVGDGKITFSISDTGQIKFSTTSMAGINHSGKLTFTAQALSQT